MLRVTFSSALAAPSSSILLESRVMFWHSIHSLSCTATCRLPKSSAQVVCARSWCVELEAVCTCALRVESSRVEKRRVRRASKRRAPSLHPSKGLPIHLRRAAAATAPDALRAACAPCLGRRQRQCRCCRRSAPRPLLPSRAIYGDCIRPASCFFLLCRLDSTLVKTHEPIPSLLFSSHHRAALSRRRRPRHCPHVALWQSLMADGESKIIASQLSREMEMETRPELLSCLKFPFARNQRLY